MRRSRDSKWCYPHTRSAGSPLWVFARRVRVRADAVVWRPRETPAGDTTKEDAVTLVWFVVWGIWSLIGDTEPIRFDPVNVWGVTLLFVAALDLARQHAPGGK